jgi:hypothetical protein
LAKVELILTRVSTGISALPAPDLGAPLPSWQLDRLVEDLALSSTQFAAVPQEYAGTIMLAAHEATSNPGQALQGLAYAPRARSFILGLRRAEAWQETVDHELGAHATLPGFAPGDPSIETQLGLR